MAWDPTAPDLRPTDVEASSSRAADDAASNHATDGTSDRAFASGASSSQAHDHYQRQFGSDDGSMGTSSPSVAQIHITPLPDEPFEHGRDHRHDDMDFLDDDRCGLSPGFYNDLLHAACESRSWSIHVYTCGAGFALLGIDRMLHAHHSVGELVLTLCTKQTRSKRVRARPKA